MSEEEILSLNGYLADLYQAMQIGDIVFEPKHSTELYNLINKVLEENKKYKEEKRLILKDIKEWIACAKNEELEGDYIHDQYWDMFETILRKTFQKYNSENLSDEDLKYNHYLEKENEDLILEIKKYKETISKALNLNEKIINMRRQGFSYEQYKPYLLKQQNILKEVEHE